MSTLPILFRDEHLLAVCKPTGMLVHRSALDAGEACNLLDQLTAQVRCHLHLLHRLDRPVGGVLLCALHADAARRMSALFQRGQVAKSYLAIVRGHVRERGVIDYALREECDAITDAQARGSKPAQEAVTAYEPLRLAELPMPAGRYATARFSLLELTPQTGRRHQLRRHLKHISHPILGDTTHGDGAQNRFARERLGCERLLLFARSVRFQHPFSGAPLTVTAPLDAHFEAVMRRLGWSFSQPLSLEGVGPG